MEKSLQDNLYYDITSKLGYGEIQELTKRLMNYTAIRADINVSPEFVDSVVCFHFNAKPQEIRSKCKRIDLVIPRQVCMCLRSLVCSQPYKIIGYHFMKDHATVWHSKNKVFDFYQTDNNFRSKIWKILNDLNCRTDFLEQFIN